MSRGSHFIKGLILALALIATVVFSTSARAAGINCSVSMTAIAFGNIDVLPGAAIDTTGTISITCDTDPNLNIRTCVSINAGSASDATSRQMTGSASAKLRLDLYSNSARTQKWGSYVNGFDTAGVPFNFSSGSTGHIVAPLTVYARVLANQQTAVPGSYTSTFSGQPSVDYNDQGSACPVNGHTATTTFTATATVISSCNVSATTLDFGSAATLGSNVDQTSTVSTTCTSGTAYNIGLDAGTSAGATVTTRKMSSLAGNKINYSLFRNSGRTTNWGNTVGTDTVSATGNGAAQNVSVFGRVPSQTTPAPASYADTIVATITY
jgi:spore coat protein U-like protein